ncbi:MAG: hypothetical protein WDO13_05055 [Verrucomicrobiota bacterium]
MDNLPEHVTHLFQHLVRSGYIEQIGKIHREYLGIFSPAPSWPRSASRTTLGKNMVPPEVAACIKKGCFFGFRP